MTILDLQLVLVQLVSGLVPLHLGPLHPVERALTLGLAFGPFVVLGAVVWWRRRHEDDHADEEPAGPDVAQEPLQRDR